MNKAEKLYIEGTKLLETNPAKAIEFLSKSLELDPEAPPALYNRVVAFARLGRDTEAITDLTRLEEIAPVVALKLRRELELSVEPYTDIAKVEYRAGNFKMAITKCDSALAYNPQYGDAWVVKGMALAKLGEIEKALECYNNAAKFEPANYWAFLNRAELHHQHKRFKDALSDFSKAIELRPGEPDAYAGRSAVFFDLQLPEKATADKCKAEELRVIQQPSRNNRQKMDYVKRLEDLGCFPPSDPPDQDVEALEAAIGVSLPPAYRSFLLSCGGWWGNILCPCREPTPFGLLHGVVGFYDAGHIRNFLSSSIVPRNMVTIAYGNRDKCMSVAGVDRGFVYALDAEFRVYWDDEEFIQRFDAMADSIRDYLELRREHKLPEKPNGYESLYLIANDFDEFISCCQSSS